MDTIYRLPIVYDTGIVSECWTSYKLAVILNDSKSIAWLASHFELYMEEDGWIVFGSDFDVHPLSYYNEILQIKDINYKNVSEADVVNTIINLLNKKNYITIDCMMENSNIHERMIYGYDLVEKVFFTLDVDMEPRMKEKKVTFERVKNEYHRTLEFLKQNKMETFLRRRWFYTITALQLKGNYQNDNAIYDMLKKIFKELHGCKILREEEPFLRNEDIKISYTGLACLHGVSKVLKEGGFPEERVTDTLVKLYEHRTIIQKSMEWFCEELNLKKSKIHVIAEEYKKIIGTMKELYLLSLKNDTKKVEGFEYKITNKLNSQYYKEKQVLKEFYDEAINCIININ